VSGIPWRKVALAAAALLLLGGSCTAGCVGWALGKVKASPPYVRAVALAREDPRVAGVLGAPVRTGWYVLGSIRLQDGDRGHADLSIPLLGSKQLKGTPRTGKLHVVAEKRGGAWVLETLDLVTMTGPATFDTLRILP